MQRRTKPSPKLPCAGATFAAALLCGALVWGAGPARAEPAAETDAEAEVAVETIPLDQLLRLPAGSGSTTRLDKRGGHTKSEWETRFRAARTAQAEAVAAIARTRAAIEAKVLEDGGGQWRMGAPGLGNLESDATDSPLDYKLTQQLRRNRDDLARAERGLQDLEVEANLASVPDDWRAAPVETATDG